jgi:hypothetical protein
VDVSVVDVIVDAVVKEATVVVVVVNAENVVLVNAQLQMQG